MKHLRVWEIFHPMISFGGGKARLSLPWGGCRFLAGGTLVALGIDSRLAVHVDRDDDLRHRCVSYFEQTKRTWPLVPKVCREDIVLRCRRAGVMITQELVDTIFEEYELDKKRAP